MSVQPDIAAIAKRRFITMAAINGVGSVAAVVSAVAAFKYHVTGAVVVFAAALFAGFAAQIWFIAGLRAPKQGA